MTTRGLASYGGEGSLIYIYCVGFGHGGVVAGPSCGGAATVNVFVAVAVCVPFAS